MAGSGLQRGFGSVRKTTPLYLLELPFDEQTNPTRVARLGQIDSVDRSCDLQKKLPG